MRGKIFRTTLGVTLITLVVCVSIVMGMIYSFYENSYSVGLKNEAYYVASSVDTYGIEYVENVDFGDMRISYIKKDGTVLYDNRADAASMENHLGREEVDEALESGYGESARLSGTLSEKNYYIAHRLLNGDVIRVSDARQSEWALFKELFRHVLIVVILSVVLSAVFSVRLAKNVVKPINEINLSEPENTEIYEELTPLLKRVREQNKQIKEQIDQLEKERREFSQLTDNMSEGFIVVDTAAKILSSNTAAAKLLGEGQDVYGKCVYNLHRSDKFIKCVDGALSGKRESTVLEEKEKFINVFANPVYESGHVIGALLLLMDVTEREGRETLRREFTANVSHELKTPLTSISAAAEMLMSGMVKHEDTKDFSEKIYSEAQRLINLVNDIIKLSKLDEGGNVIDFEEIDGSKVVKLALNAVKDAAKKKNITICEDVDAVKIRCVTSLFEEIAYNLCDNAVKYTPEGGEIKVSFKEKGDSAVLTVSDNGIGIPKAEHERVFERFYRVDKSHATTVSGTGLGLSIVKHAVLMHNGTIKLESEEGKGSTFTVVI